MIAEIGRPLMDTEVDVVGSFSAEEAAPIGSGAGRRIDLTKYRNITSLPTNRLIPRASILILQQQQSNPANQREQLQHYRTNLKIDIEQGAGDNESVSTKGTAASWPEYDPHQVVAQMDAIGSSFVGHQTAAPVPAHSVYEHVDKTIKLSLEPKCLDPLSNAYVSVKNGRGDQKSEMIIVTPSQVAPSHDRELVSVGSRTTSTRRTNTLFSPCFAAEAENKTHATRTEHDNDSVRRDCRVPGRGNGSRQAGPVYREQGERAARKNATGPEEQEQRREQEGAAERRRKTEEEQLHE